MSGYELPSPLAALTVGLLITLIVAAFVRDWEVRERRTRLEQLSLEHVEALKGQLIRSIEVLYAIESLVNARKQISRQEFRQFVANTLARRREIQGLAWDPRVPASARSEWEARARLDGLNAFQFVEQGRDGAIVPAGERPEYVPVYFMENLSGNEPALGFDLRSETKRRVALERARDTGRAAATAPIRLVQESGSQLGFLVLLPVYEGGVSSVDERRERLRGFAVAVYRIGDLVEASLQTAIARGLSVTVTDAGSGETIYRRRGGSGAGVSRATTIDVAGRQWSLAFDASPMVVGLPYLWESWASFGAGTIITLLLAAYLWSVRARTAELAASNEALQVEVGVRQHAEAEADRANRAKSAFLANMSHEIRTPLNAILGYAQILLRHDPLDSFQRVAVQTIAGSSSHLLHLINEILQLSKIDAGRMEVSRAEFDLQALVHEIVVMFYPSCAEKDLTLCTEGLRSGLRVPVIGDAGKLRQVLINLLGNAVKFTERGCVTFRLSACGDGHWRFDIEDTGPGIPAEVGECVFEAFQQVRAAGDTGGTGLGLTIARRQVELMGGVLALQRGGGGSLFHFTLHLPLADLSLLPGAMAVCTYRLAEGHRVRALVVDDVSENRGVLSRMLDMAGCETVVAKNGPEALRLAGECRPDIVFVDLRLPEIDGIQVARQIHRLCGPAIRVVATSASVLDGERERCLESGCDEFLAKPFLADQIYEYTARLLGVTFDVRQVTPVSAAAFEGAPIALPEALVGRLLSAAELHSATGLRACLDDLDRLGPEASLLTERLRSFLNNYDMEAIQRIVGSLPASAAGVIT